MSFYTLHCQPNPHTQRNEYYYRDPDGLPVPKVFYSREEAWQWVEEVVIEKFQSLYEIEDPLVKWYKEGVKTL